MPSAEQIRLAGDLDVIYDELSKDSSFITKALEGYSPRARGIIHPPSDPFERMDSEPSEAGPVSAEAHAKVEATAISVVERVRNEGINADLTQEEEDVFEAIIHAVGRPALFIMNGGFTTGTGEWRVLEDHRTEIESNISGVGRIEVEGHRDGDWWGTGFLVADDVVMTNRHVAKKFCFADDNGKWHFRDGMTARIDFVEEVGAMVSAEFALTEVIGVHSDVSCDMALFRMAATSTDGQTAPPALTLASDPGTVALDQNIYVIGYPAFDTRNDIPTMLRTFNNTFEVKRLQPGKVSGLLDQPSWFMHDCSTLGGNSGSCVVDLATNQVLGLHFKGRYQENNFAVALWRIQDDPLVKAANLNFA